MTTAFLFAVILQAAGALPGEVPASLVQPLESLQRAGYLRQGRVASWTQEASVFAVLEAQEKLAVEVQTGKKWWGVPNSKVTSYDDVVKLVPRWQRAGSDLLVVTLGLIDGIKVNQGRDPLKDLVVLRSTIDHMPIGAKSFPDIPDNHWFYEFLARLKVEGVLRGFEWKLRRGPTYESRYELAECLSSTFLFFVQRLTKTIDDVRGARRIGNPPVVDGESKDLIDVAPVLIALFKRSYNEFREELKATGNWVFDLNGDTKLLLDRLNSDPITTPRLRSGRGL